MPVSAAEDDADIELVYRALGHFVVVFSRIQAKMVQSLGPCRALERRTRRPS